MAAVKWTLLGGTLLERVPVDFGYAGAGYVFSIQSGPLDECWVKTQDRPCQLSQGYRLRSPVIDSLFLLAVTMSLQVVGVVSQRTSEKKKTVVLYLMSKQDLIPLPLYRVWYIISTSPIAVCLSETLYSIYDIEFNLTTIACYSINIRHYKIKSAIILLLRPWGIHGTYGWSNSPIESLKN